MRYLALALALAAPCLAQDSGTSSIAPFGQAAFGRDFVKLDGNAVVDSYSGTYDPANPGDNGDVRSNTDVTLEGNAKVNGDATGGDITLNGNNAVITGTQTENAPAVTYPVLEALVASKATTNDNANITTGLTGTEFKLQNGDSASLPAGDYYFTDFKMQGDCTLTVTGAVRIFLAGPMDLSGKAKFNSGGDPKNAVVISSADDTKAIKISGQGVKAWGLFYAMNTQVQVSVNGEVFGAITAKEVKLSGNAKLHYPADVVEVSISFPMETDEPTKSFDNP